MLKINQIRCPINQEFNKTLIIKKIGCKEKDIIDYKIERQSLDARHAVPEYIYSVLLNINHEEYFLNKKDVSLAKEYSYQLPKLTKNIQERPLVVGFGPAGIFASLVLAESGLKPIIIEKGKTVEDRITDVNNFLNSKKLNSASNMVYGEGGAGTFSDGKLTSRSNDPRISKIFEEFIEAGANKEISYLQRPHLGTDVLQKIIPNIRKKIINLGGEIFFETTLLTLIIENNKLVGIHTDRGDFYSSNVLLCLGHSSITTYKNLLKQNIHISQKDFALGIRVEHKQAFINKTRYKEYANLLPPASYELTALSNNGRGVYSFCMCPGGIVIPTCDEDKYLSINGMSYNARNAENGNSAILVQVYKKDFNINHPLAGFDYLKIIEKKAYNHDFKASSQNIYDFINNQTSSELTINSSYPLGTINTDINKILPAYINESLKDGFKHFNKIMPGFIDYGIMLAAETRSSSPIRLDRNKDGQSINMSGLYPCGEGAGYAGGIMSSALDGLKQAENLINKYNK